MANVTIIRHVIPISVEITQAINDLDTTIAKAIDTAKAAGLPQGFVVSILRGHAALQTNSMGK
ncbi:MULTISPECIES: hypothetical protein [unclassified Pseudomonas]|uniref:hypothetical protein n=1 Tax=unclassified Pseudomonas TaxID=196821 RepID=UPI002E806B0A|nr:hypothetical protein [Pseudomonas sp. 10C3]MEE3507750.1 hypothetical protein [Pseudomonas sp. 10C3]